MLLTVEYQKNRQIEVNVTTGKGSDEEKTFSKSFTELPAVLSGEKGTITFMPNSQVPITEDGKLEIIIQHPLAVAKSYRKALAIEPTSKTTSVATISISNTNKKRR